MDVSNNAPIPAFCSSDEEEADEDSNSLLYLPIAPEIEEPEEHWVPGVDGPGDIGSSSGPGERGGGSKRGGDATKENASPTKRTRTKTTEIALPNAPKDGEKQEITGGGGGGRKIFFFFFS